MATASLSENDDEPPALCHLSIHLLHPRSCPLPKGEEALAPAACAGRATGVDEAALAAYLRGRHHTTHAWVYEFLVARLEL